jgi:hypothetical protein
MVLQDQTIINLCVMIDLDKINIKSTDNLRKCYEMQMLIFATKINVLLSVENANKDSVANHK